MSNLFKIGLVPLLAIFMVSCGSDRAGNDINASNSRGVLGVSTLFPDAQDDNVTIELNQSVLIDVLQNDTIDNNSTLSLVDMPKNGTVTIDDEKILYTPNADFRGTDKFTYAITNALDEQDSANVRVSVGIGIDSDGDGLGDEDELALGTDPHSSDSDGDGLLDGEEFYFYDTNVTNPDSDGDGLTDAEEINTYNTDATNPDSDGDGLTDAEEINTYDTNATNPDSDNDGLTDAEEIKKYDTNATNPDSDGDCLLDSFEVLNYETNATNPDTDGDKVNDGIEVYAYSTSTSVECLSNPETLDTGENKNPAIDNLPKNGTDVINALDPNNDSDGDGQVNSRENNCSEGNPLDSNKICAYLTDSEDAKDMSGLGYAYIPGGFDVDGDGVNETGFWMSRYQARRTEEIIPAQEVIDTVGIVNQYISKTFAVVNRKVSLLAYSESKLDPTSVLAGTQLLFDEQQVTGTKRISQFTPYLAEVCMSKHKLITSNGKVLDLNVTIPTHKQYMHVKKLLDADKTNGGNGRHIRNGLLGIDANLPLTEYTIVIDEFGETKKEYVRNLVQLVSVTEGTVEKVFDFEKDAPSWWEADPSKFRSSIDGAASTQDLGFGIGLTKDPYAVIVRGGDILDLTLGVSGADTDGESDSTGISFRAATPYFK